MALLLATIAPGWAADLTIGILPFQRSSSVPDDTATTVEQFVYSAFTGQQRFRVLERARIDAVASERDFQDASSVVNPSALRDLGAEFVVSGEVTRVDIVRSSRDGITSYRGSVAFGLRIIDVSTGAVAGSEEFSNGRGNPLISLFSGFTGDTSTPAGALDIALQQSRKQLERFIGGVFAATGQIVSIESMDRKGMPSMVLVSLGVADGVERKTVLNAYTTETIQVGGNDLVRKRPVAELVFEESQGDHLSVFKVREGGSTLKDVDGTEVLVEFKR